jgi:hypothetical protein
MKTRFATLASVLALGAAVGANGCVDNRASIQIQAICVPTDDCTFAETCDAQYIGYPTLDVGASAADRMWLVLQVENQLLDNGDPGTGKTNTNDAHVDETEIEYTGVALPTALVGSNYYVPAEGTAVISAEVIPDVLQAGAALGAIAPTAEPREIVATIRMRGYLDDGSRFETGGYPITIRVCTGCVGSVCGGGPTCPPDSDGQLPLSCPQ